MMKATIIYSLLYTAASMRGVDMHYITVATDDNEPHLSFLKATAASKDWELQVLGLGTKWAGWGTKLREIRAFVHRAELANTDIVLFTDGYDVVFVGDPDTVLERYLAFNHPIVFSAEMRCWPDDAQVSQYPPENLQTEFPFLNGGGFIGTVAALRQIFSEADFADDLNDQSYSIEKYLLNPDLIVLDFKASIFLTCDSLVDINDLNPQAGSLLYKGKVDPQFIHACGKGWNFFEKAKSFVDLKATQPTDADQEVVSTQNDFAEESVDQTRVDASGAPTLSFLGASLVIFIAANLV
jgi:hypothetical protein